MKIILYIAAGGAAGSVLRYWMSNGVHRLLGTGFPYGTLSVNLLGSVLIGVSYILLIERMDTGLELRGALLIGVLGSFTTFSTFSIETLNLLEAGEQLRASLNILLSITLCLCGCWLGMLTGRQL